MEGDIADDPFYRLVFPTMDMLAPHHRAKLEEVAAENDPFRLKEVVDEIREDLNPHPAGQKALNAPKKGARAACRVSPAHPLPPDPSPLPHRARRVRAAAEDLTGVQHKYSETVLFFPAAGQTCHAYCTYCFRWAQFIGDSDLRFAQKDAGSLFNYLDEHPEVRRPPRRPALARGPTPSVLVRAISCAPDPAAAAHMRLPRHSAPRLSPPGLRHSVHGRRPDVHEDAADQGVLRAVQGPRLPPPH